MLTPATSGRSLILAIYTYLTLAPEITGVRTHINNPYITRHSCFFSHLYEINRIIFKNII